MTAITGVILTLPEPPSSNRYWRNVNGRMVLSKDAKTYRASVSVACMRARIRSPITGPVAVTLRWFRGRKSGDLDNRIKQTLDSIQGVIVGDDAQVCELHCYREDDKTNPRLELEVKSLSSLGESDQT